MVNGKDCPVLTGTATPGEGKNGDLGIKSRESSSQEHCLGKERHSHLGKRERPTLAGNAGKLQKAK